MRHQKKTLLKDMGLSGYALRCLQSIANNDRFADLPIPRTVENLTKWSTSDLLSIKYLGATTLEEIRTRLASFGLTFQDETPEELEKERLRKMYPGGKIAISVKVTRLREDLFRAEIGPCIAEGDTKRKTLDGLSNTVAYYLEHSQPKAQETP